MQGFWKTQPADAIGKFAVVRQHGSTRERGKFSVLHDSIPEAEAECARLASLVISQEGAECNSVFYVLEIKGCMGMRGKKLVSVPCESETQVCA